MDWADGLPADVLLAILHRLDHIAILLAAGGVCRSWPRAAREEPSLWRRITMRGHEGIARWLNRCGVACEAVRRAAGQCEAFCGEYAGDDGFIVYLTEQAPSLKSLRLISCNGVTNEGVAEAVKELPLLEELELSLCDNVGGSEVFEVVGEACPQLKHFRLCKKRFDVTVRNKDNDVRGIATMHGLHSLQLFSNLLTNKGLETILDNCPHLESLDIRYCFNIDMDQTLLLKCARINTVRIPDDPIDDYNLEVQSPIRTYCFRFRFRIR
ncbi:putative F-box/LRR-repeat protein 23 [Setaria italica]|nr:putative F-box/LRR-repeat protein 23 [Setaria italica]